MTEKVKNGKTFFTRKQKKIMFYVAILTLPILQVLFFYCYVNINSVILAFQKYSIDGANYSVSFSYFSNFVEAFEIIKSGFQMVKNSVIFYGFNLIVGFTLALVFSFYIYKKYPFSKVFQIILFAPNLISSVVFVMLFRYIVEDVYMSLTSSQYGLLSNMDIRFATLVFYNVWIGFGVNVILFSGAMSGIDESIVEAAQLDGVNIFQEFLHVSIPLIFPTFTSFVIIGMVGIFTNQMNLVTFYGSHADANISTFGYYLYNQASISDVISPRDGIASYPVLSALGLILTFIMVPLVMIVKKMLGTFGPSAD